MIPIENLRGFFSFFAKWDAFFDAVAWLHAGGETRRWTKGRDAAADHWSGF